MLEAPAGPDVPPGFHPPVPDADSAGFWAGTRQNRLLLQSCDGCGTYRWPPRPICWSCGSTEVTETWASGRATAYTWTVIHHATTRVDPSRLPYTVVLGALEEDPRILVPGQLEGDRADLRSGCSLVCTFHAVSDDVTVLHWAIAPDQAVGVDVGQGFAPIDLTR